MNNIKIKLKTSELTGAALDWAVARCELGDAINEVDDPHFYSTDWALGGPIIEQEKNRTDITMVLSGGTRIWADEDYEGPTPLIAAMRCYVASQLGDEVEVPDELKEVMA
jgi:hypothetical protein